MSIFKKIEGFLSEIKDFFRRFMGPDLSESELLEDEENNEYFYRKLYGFNELEDKNKRILDEAMEDVLKEESKMSIKDALNAVKQDKLSTNRTAKSFEKANEKAKETQPSKANKTEKIQKEQRGVDRDI